PSVCADRSKNNPAATSVCRWTGNVISCQRPRGRTKDRTRPIPDYIGENALGFGKILFWTTFPQPFPKRRFVTPKLHCWGAMRRLYVVYFRAATSQSHGSAHAALHLQIGNSQEQSCGSHGRYRA